MVLPFARANARMVARQSKQPPSVDGPLGSYGLDEGSIHDRAGLNGSARIHSGGTSKATWCILTFRFQNRMS